MATPVVGARTLRAGVRRRPLPESWVAAAFIAPAAIVVLLVVVVPLGRALWMSLFHIVLTRPGVEPFVGLDTGWNVLCEHFIYDAILDVVLCRAADQPPTARVVISGNINEGDDLFAEDYPFPDVREGDIVAAISVGSYNASMTSPHSAGTCRPSSRSSSSTRRVSRRR